MVAAYTNGFISYIDKCFHSLLFYNFLISTTNHIFFCTKRSNFQYELTIPNLSACLCPGTKSAQGHKIQTLGNKENEL